MKKLLIILFILPCLANARSFYVSTSLGNDANSVTQAQSQSTPWKTTSKVLASWASLLPGDSILYKRGESFVGRFTLAKNGIYIGAYGTGAQPIFTGFTSLTGWTAAGTNKWQIVVPGTNAVKMIVQAGVVLKEGRTPNTGWLTYPRHIGNNTFKVPTLANSPNFTGATLHAKVTHDQITTDSIINHTDSVIVVAPTSGYAPQDNYGLFISNSLATLDTAGEWHFAKSGRILTIYSATAPVGVQVSTQDTLIDVRQYADVTIENISLQGANVDAISFGGPKVGTANRTTIKNCTINCSGNDAIYGSNNNNATITGNTITNSLNNAIELENEGGRSQFATITNNRIVKSGMIPGMGQKYNAIVVWGDNALVQNNNIDSCGLTGVSFYYNHVRVLNNIINHYCMTVDDAGAINVFDPSHLSGPPVTYVGREIAYNIILNGTFGVASGTPLRDDVVNGIYCDDYSNNVYIHDNSVSIVPRAGFYIHNGTAITFRNNTIFGSASSQYEISHDRNAAGSPIRGITITSNIFASTAPTQFFNTIRTIRPFSDLDSMGIIDSNVHARPSFLNGSVVITRTNGGRDSLMTFAVWRQRHPSKDVNSTVAPVNSLPLRFYYNWSDTIMVLNLRDSIKYDMKGVRYVGQTTIAPYASKVLQDSGFVVTINLPPTAYADTARTITLPTGTTTFHGSGTDPGGTIQGYSWSKFSGPATGTIISPNAATTVVNGLGQGVHTYQLIVTDNLGLMDTALVVVTVNPAIAPPNAPPTVTVRPVDTTIVLPSKTITAVATAVDSDGTITSYLWVKLLGPAGDTIVSPTSATTVLKGLSEGNYTYQVTVKDNSDSTAIAIVTVHVQAAPVNLPPTADAGIDQTIVLPVDSVVLSGSGIDLDGSIAGYQWTEGVTVLGTTQVLHLTGLTQGTHTYTLTVTDNLGATGTNTMYVFVNPAVANDPTILHSYFIYR